MSVHYRERVAKVTFRALRDRPGVAAEVIQLLRQEGYTVLAASFDSSVGGRADFSVIVYESEGVDIRKRREEIAESTGAKEVIVDSGLAFLEFLDVLDLRAVLETLANMGINLEFIALTSGVLGVAIRRNLLEDVLLALHEEVPNAV
ncbi:MAG: hypothetical protein GXO29_04545 [Thermotogae bacterium]|nr:hypothetical protein [Thermotogota bacterium]